MNKIDNWYWQYGIKRGNDPADPDRALRKITVGGWLDPISHTAEKVETLRRSLNLKSTIALWGPSQTGKSTLLSRYLDGIMADGSDSALTWNKAVPVRFSPDRTVGLEMASLYPSTIVFNPYNNGSDASGVATRYTLATDSDAIDKECPVEFRFVSRMEVLHAIALGYLTECNPVDDNINYRQDDLLQRLNEGASGMNAPPNPEAYAVLRDLADLIELLKSKDRFANLFRRGEWERKIRPAIVSAPQYASDVNEAWKFAFEMLWDGATKLTDYFRRIEALRQRLEAEWAGASRILLSPEVAALLLDIGTLERMVGGTEQYQKPDANLAKKVASIASVRDSSSGAIRITIAGTPSDSPVAGETFGLFQALCAEIVVPVRREALESNGKTPMLAILEQHDLLDLPGLGRKDTGLSGQSADKDRKNALALTDLDFYKVVLKIGRTQCIVDGHVASFAIDSIVVLNSALDAYPAKSGLITKGIENWLKSFDPDWNRGKAAPLPVFLDLTFFAKAINDVQMNGVTQSFSEYATRSLGTQDFADKRTCRWFVTTYPIFHNGQIVDGANKSAIVEGISSFEPFMGPTGLAREDIEAVFNEDGGVDRMLNEIARNVNPDARRSRCAELLRKELAKLEANLRLQLPSKEQVGLDARKSSLRETAEAIRYAVRRIEDGDGTLDYAGLSLFMRNLFSAQRDIFEPVLRNAKQKAKERKEWLKRQVARWFDDAEKRVEDGVVDAVHQRELLATLRDNVRISDGDAGGEHGLDNFLCRNLGLITDNSTASAARFPFSVAFGNILRTGRWDRSSNLRPGESDPGYLASLVEGAAKSSLEREKSPYWKTVIEPLLERIDYLSENALAGTRPPQPGDEELKEIVAALF